MTLYEKSPVWAVILAAIAVFAIETIGMYVMEITGNTSFSWGKVLMSYGSIMYILIGISVIAVRHTKYFLSIGIPLMFSLNLIGCILEYGMIWKTLILAIVLSVMTILMTFILTKLINRNYHNSKTDTGNQKTVN